MVDSDLQLVEILDCNRRMSAINRMARRFGRRELTIVSASEGTRVDTLPVTLRPNDVDGRDARITVRGRP